MSLKKVISLACVFLALTMVGCAEKQAPLASNSANIPEDKDNVTSKANPTPEEIMADDQNADFFIWDGVVCQNASDIDWVQELDLSGGTSLGKIKRSGIKEDWQDWDATVLEGGTEILELPKSGGVMIARKDGKNVAYLKLLEG